MADGGLRPIERRVLRLVEAGVSEDEIGRRFRRRRDSVDQLIKLARLPGRAARPHDENAGHLRPIERCILVWRARGLTPAEIAPRFRRSESFVAQVETLANYKLELR
jgi:DNA-binding CsgD family transcriptional regulator